MKRKKHHPGRGGSGPRQSAPGAAPGRQCAALPFRQTATGELEVMLVTSRQSGRWVLPKGWKSPKLSLAESALREAFEEAGVVGRLLDDRPAASYRYNKQVNRNITLPCDVAVFLLQVSRQLDRWPEQTQRQVRWVSPQEAAQLVREPELAEMLGRLPAMVLSRAAHA